MSNIELHRHEELGIELRTYMDQQGPVVSAEDLAKSLGYTRTEYMIRMLRGGQIKEVSREDLGLAPGRPIRYITESGLYRAVLRSNMPKAVEFQEWVEDEVLPSIRHEGGYISNTATAEQLTQLQVQVDKAEKRALKAEENEKATERGVQQWQRNTDREVEILLDDVRKSRDFWGNAYMRMREEAGRICREYGVSEKRLPIV